MRESSTDFSVKYEVTFSDNSYYETEDFEVVLKEENRPTRRIIAIEFTVRRDLQSPPGRRQTV